MSAPSLYVNAYQAHLYVLARFWFDRQEAAKQMFHFENVESRRCGMLRCHMHTDLQQNSTFSSIKLRGAFLLLLSVDR